MDQKQMGVASSTGSLPASAKPDFSVTTFVAWQERRQEGVIRRAGRMLGRMLQRVNRKLRIF